jgi:AraC-like DNA-binding protein/mannose-6-phosphate isomerase-like protein (cupin superfamily)
MWLLAGTVAGMAVYVWPLDMDPDFPLAVLEHVACGDSDPMHWHDYFELALVLDGSGAFVFGRQSIPAAPGDIFLIDDTQPHAAVPDVGTAMRMLLVLFRPELIAGTGCRELDLGYLAPFRAEARPASRRVPARTQRARAVAVLLHELRTTWERHDPSELHLVDATLRRALALLHRPPEPAATGMTRTADAARAAADRREQIRPVLAYVNGHCRDSVTLEDVADLVHVSPSRVRHVFKDVTGVSFKEYVTQVRVAEAKRLLLSTDLSVADVAQAVSYTNLHQFYKVFYRSCAMSPGEYRRYYMPAGSGQEPESTPLPSVGS